jgi:hypothetical protein
MFLHQTHSLCEQADPGFWGEPIHSYSRQQAIADGVLVDASVGDLAPVTRQHFGDADVAMSAALFALIERAVTNPKTWNDWRGVWHDICWMSIMLPERKLRTSESTTTWFKVIITGCGRKKYQQLKRVMTSDDQGGVEITFLLADED